MRSLYLLLLCLCTAVANKSLCCCRHEALCVAFEDDCPEDCVLSHSGACPYQYNCHCQDGLPGLIGPMGPPGNPGANGIAGTSCNVGPAGGDCFNMTCGVTSVIWCGCTLSPLVDSCSVLTCGETNITICSANGTTLVSNTVFVDGQFGNDATAQLQSPDLPFKTINASIAAAAPFASPTRIWQSYIRPSTYNETVYLRDYVNLLAFTSTPFFAQPGFTGEVLLLGSITDELLRASDISITGLIISSTEMPAVLLTSTLFTTMTNCVLMCTYTQSPSTNCIIVNNESTLAFQRSSVEVNVTLPSGNYSVVALNISQPLSSALLDDSSLQISIAGGEVATVSFIQVTNVGSLPSPAYQARGSRYSFGIDPNNPPAATIFQVYTLDNAAVLSQNYELEISDLASPTTMYLANLGSQGGTSQSVDVSGIVINFEDGLPDNLYTLNNNGMAGSTGYFAELRLRGWSAYIPTQTPTNFQNVFRQVNVLIDSQQGGQELLGTTIVTTTTYTVLEIDAVIFWSSSSNGTINLPFAASYTGRQLMIKDATNNTSVTIAAQSGDKIDFSPSITLDPLDDVTVVSDGIQTWWLFQP